MHHVISQNQHIEVPNLQDSRAIFSLCCCNDSFNSFKIIHIESANGITTLLSILYNKKIINREFKSGK